MLLNETNLKIITNYFLGNKQDFESKEIDYQNLMLTYASDLNSSTLREMSTLSYLNYKYLPNKMGADGIDEKTGRLKEVKPVRKVNKKAGHSGNFNDLTLNLLEKKKDYDIVCSLFNDLRFVYIIEFPMSTIYEKLKKPIINAKLGKRVVCHFNYKDYDCNELKVHYLNEELIHTSVSKNHATILLRQYYANTDWKFSQ